MLQFITWNNVAFRELCYMGRFARDKDLPPAFLLGPSCFGDMKSCMTQKKVQELGFLDRYQDDNSNDQQISDERRTIFDVSTLISRTPSTSKQHVFDKENAKACTRGTRQRNI